MTKRDRNKMYKGGLKHLKNSVNNGYGICDAIYVYCKQTSHKLFINTNINEESFPELFKYEKDNDKYLLWFKIRDYKSREKVLKKCIKLTEPIKKVIIKKKVNKKKK